MVDELMMDRMHEECGVFGIWGHPEAAQLTYYGLYALQHRGQESAGIASIDEMTMHSHRGMGLVTEVFGGDRLKGLRGHAAVGHVRYSTTGDSRLANAQPLVFSYHQGNMALAHNGNLVNAMTIRDRLERQGSIFQSTSDTEVVAHLIARGGYPTVIENVRDSMAMIKGGYAFVILVDDALIAMRDPQGLRPMALGRLGDAYVVASETCAFDTVGATFLRDVEPGEMIVITSEGLHTERFADASRKALCTFEYIYFARPDSDIDGYNVHMVRKHLGKILAREAPVEADVVIGVPDSSISAAIGFAEESHTPYEIGLIKNKYSGRTFIQPSQELRNLGVRLKLSAVRKIVDQKRVVMVDDSLVRGTTSARLVTLLREAGATEVHVRISSPPVKHSCFYGIDTSAREELIASQKSVDEIRDFIGADSLAFLTEDAMLSAFGVERGKPHGFCNACFTGLYPTEVYQTNKRALERQVKV
ncbi:amidophosphoribosyltransferase [Ferroacidibacillus organovorans]|uniref:Amidophosphoribosyltransferase n=1 Tax=Ferroacidibacillus organovorans TaxID=1765683 RepID=A0A101XQ81_9BACL|nr:amidophosphoribosyltransferase [Ferroacidibacillus organovorans]KUO95486.1 amidophosphoribosyltransferase [Ferroacidibacillus organovorans]